MMWMPNAIMYFIVHNYFLGHLSDKLLGQVNYAVIGSNPQETVDSDSLWTITAVRLFFGGIS
jgi:hypothetical protein